MRRVLAGALGCVVAIALAGCTGQGDEGAPEATSEQSTEAGSSLAPLVIEPQPAWTSESLGLGDVDDAQLVDGRAILDGSATQAGGGSGVLVVADADTGRELWRLEDFAPIPGAPDLLLYLAEDVLAGDPGSDVVYVVAVQASTLPFGQPEVAALSLTDGSLRWRVPTTGSPSILGSTLEQVAVRVDGLESPTPGQSASSTLVLDAETGELAWESAGFAAGVLAGDALLGSWPADPPSADPSAPGLPGVLELADGAERWRSDEPMAIGPAYTDDLGVLEGVDDTALVVDLSDGNEAAEIEGATCVDDGADAIVCEGSGPDGVLGLASVVAGEAEPTWSEHQGSIAFALGYEGYVIARGSVLDRYGNVVADDVPGVEPLAVGDDTLIVLEGTDPTALTATAHRIDG